MARWLWRGIVTQSPADTLQRRASDARDSIWVAASAGTGKTKVLIDRVLALLLGGSPPGRILCLTFTRAAAAEMSNRLHERLSRWAILPAAELRTELQKLIERVPDQSLVDDARRLFARVLDAPGGLAIETIHAFCQSLLRRFPVEAGVAPHFELMDARATDELLAAVREEVLAEARAGHAPDLADAIALLARGLGEDRFWKLLDAIAAARGRFRILAEKYESSQQIVRAITERLDLPDGATEAGVIDLACSEASFDGASLRRAAAAMVASKATGDRGRGEILAAWLGEPDRRAERFDAYLGVYFTKDGARRAALVTKAVAGAAPTVLAALEVEARRLEGVRIQRAASALREATAA